MALDRGAPARERRANSRDPPASRSIGWRPFDMARDFLASLGRKRAARMRMPVRSLRGALAAKPASVIPGWFEGPDPASRDSPMRNCASGVECCASPRNDGLKWIASLALAMRSWQSFETHRSRDASEDEGVGGATRPVHAQVPRAHHVTQEVGTARDAPLSTLRPRRA